MGTFCDAPRAAARTEHDLARGATGSEVEGRDGTGAITRVMIEFRTPDGTTWRTVGLSTNIIDASVVALGDGMIWKLQRDGIAGPVTA